MSFLLYYIVAGYLTSSCSGTVYLVRSVSASEVPENKSRFCLSQTPDCLSCSFQSRVCVWHVWLLSAPICPSRTRNSFPLINLEILFLCSIVGKECVRVELMQCVDLVSFFILHKFNETQTLQFFFCCCLNGTPDIF